ncbi:BREX system P-loop protein BrxC [Rhodopseudomonas palustris]
MAGEIASLFASDITRQIEEVIKVDQTSADIIASEIDEYVVTDAIKKHYVHVLERYQETRLKPHEGGAIWISGFFGSGKSSFAKVLGLAIEDRDILGTSAANRFAARAGDPKLAVVLKTINEQIPTHTVIFDVSTDRGIRSGNQMLTEIMYRLFLSSLGYAKEIDPAELEIALEGEGRLDKFKEVFQELNGKSWDTQKNLPIFALNQASAVLHKLEPATYPMADSWSKGRPKIDITPGRLADRIVELMNRRKPGQALIFVVDEVGQFVARDTQKMLDLQAIVQQLGVKGRGKYWIAVTSQERLSEVVSGLDNHRIELPKLMDRFPLQVHLEPSDISEVTSRRVLAKNAVAETVLGKLYDDNRARLDLNSKITADVSLPTLSRERFVDLYPLLPYQIDLIIDVVSGLRMQGGASKHVGGANRTIIKLAQQLLINPATKIAEAPIGALVRLDQVYDLVEGNINSDIRAKIISIPGKVEHPLAQAVAKVVCLLQFVRTVHRTPENIAAALVDRVDADSRLTEVHEALAKLESAHMVRQGDGGYRIPTPAEDDWDQARASIDPKRADERRLYASVLTGFWAPQPGFTLGDAKTFKAGLMVGGNEEMSGDVSFHLDLAENAEQAAVEAENLRRRSQMDQKDVFWSVALDQDIRREMREAFRSDEMIKRKGRGAPTADETALIAEEKVRQRNHMQELGRRLKAACLSGKVFFRGNDRSPAGTATEVGKAVTGVLEQVLPDVYNRFAEASAKKAEVTKGVDALLTAENLAGLPAVFSHLELMRDEQNKRVFRTDVVPLSEILTKIEERAAYGEQVTGKYLEDEFLKPPFGWDFDVMRLLTLSLLRAGKIEATSKGQVIDQATTTAAKDCFSGNNTFRAASFRPKKGIDFAVLAQASENYRDTFGDEVKELAAGPIAAEIRAAVERQEEGLDAVLGTMRSAQLPGIDVLDGAVNQMRAIRRSNEENAILTFNASHKSLKDAIKRGSDLAGALNESALKAIADAREAAKLVPVLEEEPDLDAAFPEQAKVLSDLLSKETFYREIGPISKAATSIKTEYKRRYEEALDARVKAYLDALEVLTKTPGWERLDEAQRDELSGHLRKCADKNWNNQTIRHLRSEAELAESRLADAIAKMHQILDGERLATVSVGQFFSGGIETEEQLDQALGGIRDEFARLIGEGKKVIVR